LRRDLTQAREHSLASPTRVPRVSSHSTYG
jgi:hypothetical protein